MWDFKECSNTNTHTWYIFRNNKKMALTMKCSWLWKYIFHTLKHQTVPTNQWPTVVGWNKKSDGTWKNNWKQRTRGEGGRGGRGKTKVFFFSLVWYSLITFDKHLNHTIISLLLWSSSIFYVHFAPDSWGSSDTAVTDYGLGKSL